MVRIVYLPETVDCTADPHPVAYGGAFTRALGDVVTVCTSDLVRAIRSVNLTFEKEGREEQFESDYYSDHGRQGLKQTRDALAKSYKIVGLQFFDDASVDARHHLPIGLEGVKAAVDLIGKRLAENNGVSAELVVYVIWQFAETGSCADCITAKLSRDGTAEVDYSNQDWWMTSEGYEKHCADLSELIGQEIETKAN